MKCRRSDSRYRAASQSAAGSVVRLTQGVVLADSHFALGYYLPPLQGFQSAAPPTAIARDAMCETFNAVKTILKSILYLGAIICCLAGLWVIYVTITNFREMEFPAWVVVLVIDAVWVCLTFAPAFMLLRGLNTKTWHWALIGIMEVIVVALGICALFVMVTSLRNPG